MLLQNIQQQLTQQTTNIHFWAQADLHSLGQEELSQLNQTWALFFGALEEKNEDKVARWRHAVRKLYVNRGNFEFSALYTFAIVQLANIFRYVELTNYAVITIALSIFFLI